ncbi:MAG: alpha/beta fold hydrolase [Limnohabitans sp.]|jgi:polyhydroxyalkanoate synthase|uniref:PHA/PHB synthase family protein n=1 Tax=Limnohabitans sp. TaxID=1907725 RepID=UPI0025F29E98|nr:alpha/beta fold hydrolase [Limnohabitans sp.]MCO4087587.1 alpha/beta fold hydrolase [Limnohabitans sp.]
MLDRWAHTQWSPLTQGVSMASLRMAFDDWLTHLSHNPAEQLKLWQRAMQSGQQWLAYVAQAQQAHCKPCIEPPVQDTRFAHPGWRGWPFNALSQSFLLTQQWWQDATQGVRGVSPHHEAVVSFTVRQMLDMVSPANFWLSNPEVLERTQSTHGDNLRQGFQNWLDDAQRKPSGAPPQGAEAYQVGRDVAVTPGQVVYRNHLIELIQYSPSTAKVRPEPVLIVSSWIMKYYILDLSPHNSLVKYLVDQGHTVFVLSWVNPGAEWRDMSMDDYLRLGVMDALDAVGRVLPRQPVHAVGYCLGGTLLAVAAAAMAHAGDARLASMTLIAAQTDFSEPGELALFIDDSQVAHLEDIMWDQGYLDGTQMAGAFQWMNSNDLIWSRLLKEYLLGERSPVSDLMAWNADGTRLPYRMHTEYLHRMFLNNDLASARYPVHGKPITLMAIQCPIYAVGTVRDHVAPWRSVHKLHLLTNVDTTFVLTSGGHNVGIVNPPGVPGRSYQALTKLHDGPYLDPDAWQEEAPKHEGSWWPHWVDWLQAHGSLPELPPAMGTQDWPPLCPAPGTYVLQK